MSRLVLEHVLARLQAGEAEPVATFYEPRPRGGFEGLAYSLGDLVARAGAAVEAFGTVGVSRGDRVALALRTGPDFVGCLLGAMWMGAIPVPLPPAERLGQAPAYRARVRGALLDARPRLVVADPVSAERLARSDTLTGTGIRVLGPPETPGGDLPPPVVDPTTPAFIQYTSGSTGDPKGVIVTHGNIAANCSGIIQAAGLGPSDRVLSWLPLYHDMGLVGLLMVGLYGGGSLWLCDPLHFALSPASWIRAISHFRATVTVAPNFAYNLAARRLTPKHLEGVDLSTLRVLFNGAEPVDPDTARAFLERFAPLGLDPTAYFPVYGLAETTLAAAFPPPGRALRVDHVRRADLGTGVDLVPAAGPGPGVASFVSVGGALPGHRVRIVEPETGEELPERRLGEIVVEGPSVSPGYFSADPASAAAGPPLRTGDLGYQAEGELFVVDRLKDLVIVAGRSYAPSDLERAAEEVPGVRRGRVAAVSVPDQGRGTECLVILAEARINLGRSRRRLEAEVRSRVSGVAGLEPGVVALLRPGTLERTSSGKIRRRDARSRYLSGALDGRTAFGPLDPRGYVQEWMRRRALQRLKRGPKG